MLKRSHINVSFRRAGEPAHTAEYATGMSGGQKDTEDKEA